MIRFIYDGKVTIKILTRKMGRCWACVAPFGARPVCGLSPQATRGLRPVRPGVNASQGLLALCRPLACVACVTTGRLRRLRHHWPSACAARGAVDLFFGGRYTKKLLEPNRREQLQTLLL